MGEVRVIVSNRLPVTVTKSGGKLVFTPSSGGLATAMSSLDVDESKQIWIGWPGIAADELSANEKTRIIRKLRTYGCYPVFLTSDQIAEYYDGYANGTLWPFFHYFQSIVRFNKNYWDAYKVVNVQFKKAVLKHASYASSIWVHDYQLMLLPQMLRESLPGSSIGFFLHIPFPSHEIFRQLPERKEILQGLLGADLIGFHTYAYAQHFLSSCLRILGLENQYGSLLVNGRIAKVDAFPIGIDYQKFADAINHSETKQALKVLDEHYKEQKIILSVDRLDYSKGILERLEAFEQFLAQNPKYHKKVVLVVVAVPSRVEVESYQDLRHAIEQTVSSINGTYATVDWSPIVYQFRNLPFHELVALYVKAEIALVTPLRDGMNLVAKEYVACKQKRPGVLVLSEMAGAVDELPEALHINPNDTEAIAEAIKASLRMPKKEQWERLSSMQKRLSRYTVKRWATDFMEQLAGARSAYEDRYIKLLSTKDRSKIIKDFKSAKHRIIFLDYDGTLRTFVATPNSANARPSAELLGVLKTLVSLHTKIYIISGRSREALEEWFGDLPLGLVAEHGAWVKDDGEWAQADVAFDSYKKVVLPVLERYAERTPGAVVEEKQFAVVWHYRNVPPELAYARNASLRFELKQLLAGTELGVYKGQKIIEIKPLSSNKGIAISELLATHPADFILCAGDDYTDEDMFAALPEEAYTIKVGPGETHARFQVAHSNDVLAVLKTLSDG